MGDHWGSPRADYIFILLTSFSHIPSTTPPVHFLLPHTFNHHHQSTLLLLLLPNTITYIPCTTIQYNSSIDFPSCMDSHVTTLLHSPKFNLGTSPHFTLLVLLSLCYIKSIQPIQNIHHFTSIQRTVPDPYHFSGDTGIIHSPKHHLYHHQHTSLPTMKIIR